MELKAFDSMLAKHDWFFHYSDDHRVWVKGEESWSKIVQASKLSEAHRRLYDVWWEYVRDLSQNKDQQELDRQTLLKKRMELGVVDLNS